MFCALNATTGNVFPPQSQRIQVELIFQAILLKKNKINFFTGTLEFIYLHRISC